MKFIYATYNQRCNSIDITTFDNMLLRIDCNKAEDGLKTTPNSQCALNALAIDNPMEYARLVLEKEEVKKALAAGVPKATILTYFYPEVSVEKMSSYRKKP